jgi:hypothetical protein
MAIVQQELMSNSPTGVASFLVLMMHVVKVTLHVLIGMALQLCAKDLVKEMDLAFYLGME